MNLKNIVLLLLSAWLLSACASSTKQTDELLANSLFIPEKHEIKNVPFVNQSEGYCGPATLSMLLQWNNKSVSMDELAPQVFTPGMKGSLQTDMISATRRQGLLAIPMMGLKNLLTEIAANHPVIVFENLALSWVPQWHYAVVFGYDTTKPEVLMHSGPENSKRWDMRKFERSWKLENYWGLLVLKPGELSATATELEHMNAASALEDIGKIEEAKISYLAILKKWPQSLSALMGMGNVEAKQNNLKSAFGYFDKASKLHPESEAALNNRKIIETALKRTRR